MGDGVGRVTHHPEYYLEDGSVSFLTDSVLFRVHKSFFQRESVDFQDLFENTANDVPRPGTDACPFTLDVAPEDFAQLLWVWYDKEYGYRQQTKDNWLTILKLATRWRFDKIKELALREIEALELHPAERISIYDNFGIDGERLLSSCVELCKSPSVPTQHEAKSMRMDTLIRILQAREDAQRKAVEMGHKTPTSACLEDETLREIVSKLFERGLDPRSSGTSTGSGAQALNLNQARGTLGDTPTIREPQVPDRKTQTTSQTSSYLTNGDGKGNQKKTKAEMKKLAEDKERTEAEKEKTEKEKELKEKAGKVEQKPPVNSRTKPQAN